MRLRGHSGRARSQALAYVPPERIARERREKPTNVFRFGNETVITKVFMMVPPEVAEVAVDVIDYMWEPPVQEGPEEVPA